MDTDHAIHSGGGWALCVLGEALLGHPYLLHSGSRLKDIYHFTILSNSVFNDEDRN